MSEINGTSILGSITAQGDQQPSEENVGDTENTQKKDYDGYDDYADYHDY